MTAFVNDLPARKIFFDLAEQGVLSMIKLLWTETVHAWDLRGYFRSLFLTTQIKDSEFLLPFERILSRKRFYPCWGLRKIIGHRKSHTTLPPHQSRSWYRTSKMRETLSRSLTRERAGGQAYDKIRNIFFFLSLVWRIYFRRFTEDFFNLNW